jgi:hypothetical protein
LRLDPILLDGKHTRIQKGANKVLIYTSYPHPKSSVNAERLALLTNPRDTTYWVINSIKQLDQRKDVSSPDVEHHHPQEDVEMGDQNAGTAT